MNKFPCKGSLGLTPRIKTTRKRKKKSNMCFYLFNRMIRKKTIEKHQ